MRRLDDALTRCFFMDVAPVALVRALIRHFERLESVAVAVAAGADRSSAIDALRPPVHFRRSPELAAQAGRWSAGECRRALGRLYHTEIACKTTGLPAELICRRAALALAEAA
jgi:DNA polymerase-3 subunit delta